MKTPNVGSVFDFNEDHIRFWNSNIPCVRLKLENGEWRLQPKDATSGLIVYLVRPSIIAFDKLRAIRIIDVGAKVCKAEVLFQ